MAAKPISIPRIETVSRTARRIWKRHGAAFLLLGAAYMGITGFLRLRYAFYALSPFADGAVDLKSRHMEVHRWFDGLPLYGSVETADYPPASYAVLWPLLGWLPLDPARLLWAFTSALLLIILVVMVVRESRAESRAERLFLAMVIFPMYATQLTIWFGQMGIHVLAPLIAGLILVRRNRATWKEDLLLSTLFVTALVKPTLSAPFVWIVFFYPRRMRPIVLVLIGYALLTVLAASFQEDPLLVLVHGWLSQGSMLNLEGGTVNVHKWLASLEHLTLPASLAILAGVGLWVLRHRLVDIWLQIGLVALVARTFVHHQPYDDILILLPMVALFRVAKKRSGRDSDAVIAALLFAGMWAGSLLPYWIFIVEGHETLRWLAEVGHTVLWLVAFVFLAYLAALRRSTCERI